MTIKELEARMKLNEEHIDILDGQIEQLTNILDKVNSAWKSRVQILESKMARFEKEMQDLVFMLHAVSEDENKTLQVVYKSQGEA